MSKSFHLFAKCQTNGKDKTTSLDMRQLKISTLKLDSGPLFTERTDVLPQDLVKSRSRDIGCYDDRIALRYDSHIGSAAAEMPVKY